MKRIAFFLLLLVSLTFPVFAYPPFPGGPITGAWLEDRNREKPHMGIDVGIDNTVIMAPWDGIVSHDTGHDYGDAFVYITGANGEGTLFFGDLAYDTLNMPTGFVKAGTPIGYLSGYDPNVSSGPHVHVEYRPGNNHVAFSSKQQDPVPVLQRLGVVLSGDLVGGGSGGAMDSIRFPWSIKGMYEVGKDLHEVMKKFSLAANKAAVYVGKLVYPSLTLLCILDLIIPIMLRGFVTNKRELIPKILKYTGMMALVVLWTSFTNDILLNFVETTASTFTDGNPAVTQNLSNPQLLFQHIVAVLEPGLNKISTFTMLEWMRNFGYILGIYIASFVVIGAWILACFYIVICYVEFYVSAGLSLVTVPLAVNKFTRFGAEGGVGHLLTNMFRLLFIAVIIGISVNLVKDAKPQDIFKIGLHPNQTEAAAPGTPAGTDGNAYTGDIAFIAQKYGIDPYIAIAIAMRESGGDTIEGIHMAQPSPENPASGIFQIDPGQDIVGPDGNRVTILELFPNYETDVQQNIEAGMAMLRDKINMRDGDIWGGVEAYNGGGDPGYLAKIQANYAKISGRPISSIGHTFITGEMMSKYIMLCVCLTALAIILILVPRRIAKQLGGSLELPQQI